MKLGLWIVQGLLAVAFLMAPEYIKSPQYKSQSNMERRLKEAFLDLRDIKFANTGGPYVEGQLGDASKVKFYVEDIETLYPDLKN